MKRILLIFLLLFVGFVGFKTVSDWSNRMEAKVSQLQKENKELRSQNEYLTKLVDYNENKSGNTAGRLEKYIDYSRKIKEAYDKLFGNYQTLLSQNEALKSNVELIVASNQEKTNALKQASEMNKALSLENKQLKMEYAAYNLKINQLQSLVKEQGIAQISALSTLQIKLAQNKPVCPQPIVKVIQSQSRTPASVSQKRPPVDRFN